ncbi:MAG TPA: glycosyltransferase 87 family protein [Thermoleophilaceae bacterium]|nr:glycosyltransferase 87 family protein [Thermoleophilaceae bacterium]
MELLPVAPSRVALAVALLLPLLGTSPAAAAELDTPPSQTEPPRLYERSARQVIAIASRAGMVRAERRRGNLQPSAYTNGPGRWQVSWFRDDDEVVQVQVDDRGGAILEQWAGDQVSWTMARGYDGAFGRKLNAPYVWLPLCLLFLLPFVDPRRPLRLLHLDLLVLLGFGVSHVFFNRGEIGESAPLVYPVLLYLLARLLLAGFRPHERRERLVPFVPLGWLLAGAAFLVAFRAGLNVVDSNVIDVGYAGVIGADRIADGDELYGAGFSADVEHGDTYGPVNYLLYVPFEQALGWSGAWDGLAAAHAAALVFDLLTLGGLWLLGRRLRPGAEGRMLGAALVWAWAACPYTAFALESNSNDTLVALACVAALLALTLEPARAGSSALLRGTAIGLGAAAKFVPIALAPLFATAGRGRGLRSAALFSLALLGCIVLSALPFVPDGGPRELYDRTIGYQAARPSPFSLWGQEPGLEPVQTAVKAAAVALALLVAMVPGRRDARQVAALGAAVIVAVQLSMTHWFYLYVVWLLPFALVAMLGAYREPGDAFPANERRRREREPALV